MGTIIRNTASNGTIARSTSQSTILRTPIIKRLMPDQKKICQIGDPNSMDAQGYLHRGFTGGNTDQSTVQSVGYQLVNQWINGQPVWADASNGHDPELVWYQGAYSTSASSIQQGKYMSEAFASLPGFHFTIPQVSSPLAIQSVTVYFLNMGCTWAYGPAINGNANNKNIRQSDYGFYSSKAVAGFHVLNTPTCNYHPIDIAVNSPYDEIEISQYGSVGDFKGYRDIWGNAPIGTVDGCIPILTNPVRQSYTMSVNVMQHFTQTGDGWIVPCWLPVMASQSDYLPRSGWGGTGSNNYWACVSLRDVYIDIVYDVP